MEQYQQIIEQYGRQKPQRYRAGDTMPPGVWADPGVFWQSGKLALIEVD